MSNEQKQPNDRRVETGVVQFGDDWPGLFIRGDDCFRYALSLRNQLGDNNTTDSVVLGDLLKILTSVSSEPPL